MILNSSILRELGVTRHEMTLKNRLATSLYQLPGHPISMRLSFRSGGRYDPLGKEGLAHFAEHMIVGGTKTYPSKDLLAQYIEQYGGVFGATTNTELLNINIHIADNDDLPKTAHLLDEILNHSLFDDAIFMSEQGSVLRELSDRLSNPSRVLLDMYKPLFFQGELMGRSVLGSEETIRAITLEDIRHFFATQLNTGHARLIISGGTTMETVASTFEKISFRVPSRESVQTANQNELVRRSPIAIRRFTINDQVDFLIGYRTCGFSDPDTYGLEIIETILGGGRASTLMRKLRYEKGYVYGGSAGNYPINERDGIWVFKSACAKKDFQAVLAIICAEFQRVYEGRITDDEVLFAKSKIVKSLKRQLQTSEDWVNFHTDDEVFGQKQTVDEYVHGISAVDSEILARIGKKYFQPDTWYMALAGDIDENDFVVPR